MLQLFLTFLKIGLFTFGGGYAMIANIREVVVEKRGWLDEDELLQVITVAESTPGPIAVNMLQLILVPSVVMLVKKLQKRGT